MKQTAVEWLIEQLECDDSKIARVIGLKKYNQVVSQAKEMEKQQGYSEEDMKEAYKWGRIYDMTPFEEWFEQFKKK